jgi:general stress protein YciG
MRRVGFAAMDPEKRRAISAKGGKTAHALGRAHKFTKEEARIAGRLGGELVSQDREHMAEIGRRGGSARRREDEPAT